MLALNVQLLTGSDSRYWQDWKTLGKHARCLLKLSKEKIQAREKRIKIHKVFPARHLYFLKCSLLARQILSARPRKNKRTA